jgi:hypothetical protein
MEEIDRMIEILQHAERFFSPKEGRFPLGAEAPAKAAVRRLP